jgi:hypothetical protein
MSGQDQNAPHVADLAFGAEREERLRRCGEKVFAGGSRGKQIAADSMQQLTAESEFFLPETIGEKAKVADALKARRQVWRRKRRRNSSAEIVRVVRVRGSVKFFV